MGELKETDGKRENKENRASHVHLFVNKITGCFTTAAAMAPLSTVVRDPEIPTMSPEIPGARTS